MNFKRNFHQFLFAHVLFSQRANFQACLLIGTRLFFLPGVSIGSLGEREAEASKRCTKGRLHTLKIHWFLLINRQFWWGCFCIFITSYHFSGRWQCFVERRSAFGTHLLLYRDGWGNKNMQWRYLSMMLFVKWKKPAWPVQIWFLWENRIRRSGSYLHLRILHLIYSCMFDPISRTWSCNKSALRDHRRYTILMERQCEATAFWLPRKKIGYCFRQAS